MPVVDYIDLGRGYTGVFVLKISQALHLRFVHLLVCIFQYKV